MRLDCGCGNRPIGDVNVDVARTKTKCVFVMADTEHLPFRDNSFSEVYSHYLLPYIKNVKKAIMEMIRVTFRTVRIWIPHRLSATARHQKGFHSFNASSFYRVCMGLYRKTKAEIKEFIKIQVNYEFLRLGKILIPLPLPASMWIQIWKPRLMESMTSG